MKILHVTRETGTDSRYGIRKGIEPVLHALKKRGHEVEIFDQDKALTFPGSKAEKWVEKIYLKILRLRFGKKDTSASYIITERIRIGSKAAKYAAINKFTHVHCHDPLLAYAYSQFASFYGATKCWGYTIPAFGRYAKLRLGITVNQGYLKHLQHWELKAATKAKWVISQTNSGMNEMREDLGLDEIPQTWHVLGNPVKKLIGDRENTRNSLGIRDDQKLLLGIGQLIPLKRFSLLLESVALLPSDLRPYILILGEGPEEPVLCELAEKLNLTHGFEIRVTDQVGDFLAAADLYVSVSSTESHGNANCEAVLAGVPSICTAVGGMPELIGKGAMMVNDDPKEIASAMALLLSSEAECDILKEKARMITGLWSQPEYFAIERERIYSGC
jgi:glycosyltransferase involved in cell wall biosynthesis